MNSDQLLRQTITPLFASTKRWISRTSRGETLKELAVVRHVVSS